MSRRATENAQTALFWGEPRAEAGRRLDPLKAYRKAGLDPTPLCFASRAEGDELVLEMFDVIGFDLWTGDGITSKAVSKALAGFEGKAIRVLLNSPGGDAFEGSAIRSILAQHEAKVIVEIHGLAASAASEIAMAGDEVLIDEGSFLMIHRAWGLAIGDANDMHEFGDMLDKIDRSLAKVYSRRTGQSVSQVTKWMDAETWFSADEAKEAGFADKVIKAKSKPKTQAAERVYALLSQYDRTPADLINEFQSERGELLVAAMATTPKGPEPEESSMNPLIAVALGLSKDASENEVLTAVKNMASDLESKDKEIAEVQSKHDEVFARLEKTEAKVQELEEEKKTLQSQHRGELFNLRIDALASKEAAPITPAQATELKQEAEELCSLGEKGAGIFERKLDSLEKGGKPVIASLGLDQRDAPEPRLDRVHGMTRADLQNRVDELNKRRRKGMPEHTVEGYVAANPQYAPLLEGKEA